MDKIYRQLIGLFFIFIISILFFSCGKEINLGKTEIVDPNPDRVIKTEKWGAVAKNQICIILEKDNDKSDAESIAEETEGEVIGFMEYINLFQIEYNLKTEEDYASVIDKLTKKEEVVTAFPNRLLELRGSGNSCNPLDDPIYKDLPSELGDALKTCGIREAWDIIKSSGAELNEVNAGVIDDGFGMRNSETKGIPGITPLEEGRDTSRGKHNHSNMVVNIIGANSVNGGVTGYASVLGDKLKIKTSNLFTTESKSETEYNPKDPTQYLDDKGRSFTLASLQRIQEQVENGSKIINCSYGPMALHSSNEPEAKAHRLFLENLAREHPDVLLIAAAPSGDGIVNGKNDYWGQKLPNLITVGGVSNDGEKIVSAEQGEDGEITLAAPSGIMYDEGDSYGYTTSSCTPQVTSAAILIKSLNPELTASEIKKILIETAGKTVNGKPYPGNYGAGMLRIDDAVLKVINDIRKKEGLKPLTKEELQDLRKINLSSEGGPVDFNVIANIPGVSKNGTEVTIEITGTDYSLAGDKTKSLASPGDVSWSVSLKDKTSRITVRVIRTDTEACAYILLGGTPTADEIAGEWSGNIWYDDFRFKKTYWSGLFEEAYQELKGSKRNAGMKLTKITEELMSGKISYMVFTSEALSSSFSPEVKMNYIDGNLKAEFDSPDSPSRITYDLTITRTDNGLLCKGRWENTDGAEYTKGVIEMTK